MQYFVDLWVVMAGWLSRLGPRQLGEAADGVANVFVTCIRINFWHIPVYNNFSGAEFLTRKLYKNVSYFKLYVGC